MKQVWGLMGLRAGRAQTEDTEGTSSGEEAASMASGVQSGKGLRHGLCDNERQWQSLGQASVLGAQGEALRV